MIDRSTGHYIKYDSPEEKTRVAELAKELAFAKSWVKACGNDLSLSGDKNQLGVDSRQWEYSFNEGAYRTYNMLIQALKNNTKHSITTQNIIRQVENSSNYKYSSSILQGLLNKDNIKYDWQLNNIHSMLSKHAGLESQVNTHVSREETPSM